MTHPRCPDRSFLAGLVVAAISSAALVLIGCGSDCQSNPAAGAGGGSSGKGGAAAAPGGTSGQGGAGGAPGAAGGAGGTSVGTGGGAGGRGGTTAGLLSATFDGVPVTFTSVTKSYRYLGANLAISLVGTASTVPEFQGLSFDLYVAPGTSSIVGMCGQTSASGTFGFGLSADSGTWLTGSVPAACSGSFTMDPPAAGYGHLTGSFAGTLILLGTNVNLAVTAGAIDVIVPMQ